MKSEHSVQKSADAALKQSVKACAALKGELHRIENGESPERVMNHIRHDLAVLNQRIHEFNAYTNVLLTD